MGFFDFFKKKNLHYSDEHHPSVNEFQNKHHTDEETPKTTVNASVTHPIDTIYHFLKDNFESKGYNDALTNPDQSYKETNLAIIRSDLEINFKQVWLKYEDLLREIDFHIHSRQQAGLTDLVEQLKTRKSTYEKHMLELQNMKKDLESNELYMTGIFKSYEVGFVRGLASISLNNLKLNT